MNTTTYVVANLAALVVGQWLVTRGHWSGFLVWCAANLYSIVTCLLNDMPQTSCLFGAYFLVNFASLRTWFTKARTAALAETALPAAVTGSGMP
jgi:hypothetical protein